MLVFFLLFVNIDKIIGLQYKNDAPVHDYFIELG